MELLAQVKSNWQIIMFFMGLIFHVLWTYFRVGDHDTRLKKIEGNETTTATVINEIKETIARIDAKLDILLAGYHKEK